jgi:hypothetical protein
VRTLSLIRIALLIFILCWVGYNQSIDGKEFDVETTLQIKKSDVKELSYSVRKLSLLVDQIPVEKQNNKFRDY